MPERWPAQREMWRTQGIRAPASGIARASRHLAFGRAEDVGAKAGGGHCAASRSFNLFALGRRRLTATSPIADNLRRHLEKIGKFAGAANNLDGSFEAFHAHIKRAV